MEKRISEKIQAVDIKAEARSHDSDDKAEAHYRALERLLAESAAALHRLDAMRVRFAVAAQGAPIRRSARDDSRIVTTLDAGTVVLLIDEGKKWIQIEYRDAVAQEPRSGWALKKDFRRLPRDTEADVK